jgi:hypothetical protein
MSQTADLSRPLSDDELDRLESLLLVRVDEDAVTDDTDEGVLTVSELDGLLTALVSGPVTVVASRWLPAVWAISSQRGVARRIFTSPSHCTPTGSREGGRACATLLGKLAQRA